MVREMNKEGTSAACLHTTPCPQTAAERVSANLFHVLYARTLKSTEQADPSYYTKQLPGD